MVNCRNIIYGLAALMSLFSSFTAAETGSYQIELLIFSQSGPYTEVVDQSLSSIKWPANLTELSAYPGAKQMMLDESYAALSKNPAYHAILHTAWIQAIDENSQGNPVHIQSTDGRINGYVQLQRGQTLQLQVDMDFTPGQTDNNSEPVIYRLNEKRPVQFNDAYYLDHPILQWSLQYGRISNNPVHTFCSRKPRTAPLTLKSPDPPEAR